MSCTVLLMLDAWSAKIVPNRVGFSTSAGSLVFSHHEARQACCLGVQQRPLLSHVMQSLFYLFSQGANATYWR